MALVVYGPLESKQEEPVLNHQLEEDVCEWVCSVSTYPHLPASYSPSATENRHGTEGKDKVLLPK